MKAMWIAVLAMLAGGVSEAKGGLSLGPVWVCPEDGAPTAVTGRAAVGDSGARQPSVSRETSAGTRVKDIAAVAGSGKHKLVGYGLVTGLDGSGDSDRAAISARALANMLNQFGVAIEARDFQVRNVAAVIVTAEILPLAQVGSTLDVTVSSIGDAQSLQGGILLVTPLKGADGNIYALAQGAISIGGFNASGGLDKVQKNHPTVGRVPNGASATSAIPSDGTAADTVTLTLHQPDYTTARNLAAAVNAMLGAGIAAPANAGTVVVRVSAAEQRDLVGFMSRLEALPVEVDAPARIVINERTGTVVIGARVRISPVAISHGSLTIEVKGELQVSQPAAPGVHVGGNSPGQTVVVPNRELKAVEDGGKILDVPAQATLQDLVAALNALGVKPRDLIAILQALKEAGALQAELVVL
jgi:flagellar P-ring protein FlgI